MSEPAAGIGRQARFQPSPTSIDREPPMTRGLTSLLAVLLVADSAGGAAAAYPERPITVIVPHAAGGPTDTVSRLVAESMTKTLGQPVIVENAGGGGSTVGSGRGARAEPHGYTLFLHPLAPAPSGALYCTLAFAPARAFY